MSQSPLPPPLRPEVLDYEQVRPAKQSFSLYRWGWICYLVGAVMVFGMAPFHEKFNGIEKTVPYILGTLLGMLLIGILPALIAFFIGRRSRTAATITFVAFVTLGVLGQLNDVLRYRRAQAAQMARAQISAQARQVRTAIADQIQSDKAVDFKSIEGAVSAMQDTARKTASVLSPEERAIAGFWDRFREPMVPYQHAIDVLEEKPPLKPQWIKAKDDIGVARGNIAKFRQANAAARRPFANWNKILGEELTKQKVPPAAQTQMIAMLATKFTLARTQCDVIRDMDEVYARELLNACDLLEENWGKWLFDAERETIIFDDDETLSQYNAIVARINSAVQQQEEAQKQFLKSLQ